MAPQLGWIGLGNMGRVSIPEVYNEMMLICNQGMCKNLAEKGNLSSPLLIFNRTQKRAEDLNKTLPDGHTVVASVIDELVAKSDIIFTCLGDDKAVTETIDTALKADVKGKLFVDCSTIHPETSEELAKKVTDAGAEFVAGPVFGPPAAAEAGTCKCIVAYVQRCDS